MVVIVYLPFNNNGYKGKFGQKEINYKGKTWLAKISKGAEDKTDRAFKSPDILYNFRKSNKEQKTTEGFTIAQQYYEGTELYLINEDGAYECINPSDIRKDETLRHTFSIVNGKFDAGTTKSMAQNAPVDTCLLQYKEIAEEDANKLMSLLAIR